ncbi:hypothetical protein B0H34DRAFT_707608 [Crassisporium funariophilum]|nr:hypothetical protein B0H34DRAFT_707608 [Crassisporium funariophilum]
MPAQGLDACPEMWNILDSLVSKISILEMVMRLNAQVHASHHQVRMDSLQLTKHWKDALCHPNLAMHTPTTTEMRMCDPDLFDGSPKSVESFLCSCVNQYQPNVYPTDESRIRFALSYFKSGAIDWLNALIRDMSNPAHMLPTWEAFEVLVLDAFDPHRIANAQHAFHQIRQGDMTAAESSSPWGNSCTLRTLATPTRSSFHRRLAKRNLQSGEVLQRIKAGKRLS